MDDGNGPTVAIEVSKVLADRAEEVGIDLGVFVERALRRELRRKLDEMTEAEREVLRAKLREEVREEIEWFNRYTEEHGSFADRWRRFCCANSASSGTPVRPRREPIRTS